MATQKKGVVTQADTSIGINAGTSMGQLNLLAEPAPAATARKRRKAGPNIRTRQKNNGELPLVVDGQRRIILKASETTSVLVDDKKYLEERDHGTPLPDRDLIHVKLMNALLYYAGHQLTDLSVAIHHAPLDKICEIIGYDKSNKTAVKNALRKMSKMAVEWDGFNPSGKEEWGRANLLAQVSILGDNMVSFAFPPIVRRASANPAVFARINLALQNRFNSKHTLPLFEFCRTYCDKKITPVVEVDPFKRLFGILSDMSSWKYPIFKRDILKVAIDDLNQTSDIRVVLHERIGSRNMVTHVWFEVTEVVASIGEVVAFSAEQQALIDELMRHGVSDKFAQDLVLEYPSEKLIAAMQDTEAAVVEAQVLEIDKGSYLLDRLVNKPSRARKGQQAKMEFLISRPGEPPRVLSGHSPLDQLPLNEGDAMKPKA